MEDGGDLVAGEVEPEVLGGVGQGQAAVAALVGKPR